METQTFIDWTQLTCPDCGHRLDPFGVCILADATDVARKRAPVGCGLTPAMEQAFMQALYEGLNDTRRMN
jgi:hypothetical protein